MNLLRFSLLAGLVFGITASGNAILYNWTTTVMSGLEEVPPNASPGTGLVTGTLDDVTGNWSVTSGSFSGLTAPATAAHIHGPAGPGVNAGVIGPLTVVGGTSGSLSGAGVFTVAQVTAMVNGQTYVNVHSSTFPGGEIRGQITATPVPEPATIALLGTGVALLFRRKRK